MSRPVGAATGASVFVLPPAEAAPKPAAASNSESVQSPAKQCRQHSLPSEAKPPPAKLQSQSRPVAGFHVDDFLTEPQAYLQHLYATGGQAAVDALLLDLDRAIATIHAQLPLEASDDEVQQATETPGSTPSLRQPSTPKTAALIADLRYLRFVKTAAVAAVVVLHSAKADAVAQFEQQAAKDALHLLDVSESRAKLSYRTYGLSSGVKGGVFTLRPAYQMTASPETRELSLAATELANKREEVDTLQTHYEVTLRVTEEPTHQTHLNPADFKARLEIARAEYNQLVSHVSRSHPVLGAVVTGDDVDDDLKALSGAPSEAAAKVLHDTLSQTLDSVRHLKVELQNDPSAVWALPGALQASLRNNAALGETTVAGRAVRDAIEDARPTWLETGAEMALYVGLGIAAAAFPGGVALAAAAFATLLSTRDAIEQLDDFSLKHHAFHAGAITDDPLVHESPSAVLTALAMGGALLDLGAASKSLQFILRNKGALKILPSQAKSALQQRSREGGAFAGRVKGLLASLDDTAHAQLAEAQLLRRAGQYNEAQAFIDKLPLPDAARLEADLIYRIALGELPEASLQLAKVEGADRLLRALDSDAAAVIKSPADIVALKTLTDVPPAALRRAGLSADTYARLRSSVDPEAFDAMFQNRRWSRELTGLTNPDLDWPGKQSLAEATTTLFSHRKHLDADNLFGTLKFTKPGCPAKQVIQATAELRTAAAVLREGRLAPKTKLAFNVSGNREIKLSAEMTYNHAHEGPDVMHEIDVLYQGTDGKLHAVEVKHTAAALAEKIRDVAKQNRKAVAKQIAKGEPVIERPLYLERLETWRDGGQGRLAEVVVDSEERWGQLFSEVSGPAGLEATLTAVLSRDLSLTLATRRWSKSQWRQFSSHVDEELSRYNGSTKSFYETTTMRRQP